MILIEHFIDEGAEWRSFQEDNNEDKRNRVGVATDNYLVSDQLGSFISDRDFKGNLVTNSFFDKNVMKFQNSSLSSEDRALIEARNEINKSCEKMGLNKIVIDYVFLFIYLFLFLFFFQIFINLFLLGM
jgi:transcription initiation factor TFIIIB Brf1 subunit/transcription initiation factor TFIIB